MMSAKKPKSAHAKALGAFLSGRITKAEYQECALGLAWVSGQTLTRMHDWRVNGYERRSLTPKRGIDLTEVKE
jgi:hypothetical protein